MNRDAPANSLGPICFLRLVPPLHGERDRQKHGHQMPQPDLHTILSADVPSLHCQANRND